MTDEKEFEEKDVEERECPMCKAGLELKEKIRISNPNIEIRDIREFEATPELICEMKKLERKVHIPELVEDDPEQTEQDRHYRNKVLHIGNEESTERIRKAMSVYIGLGALGMASLGPIFDPCERAQRFERINLPKSASAFGKKKRKHKSKSLKDRRTKTKNSRNQAKKDRRKR